MATLNWTKFAATILQHIQKYKKDRSWMHFMCTLQQGIDGKSFCYKKVHFTLLIKYPHVATMQQLTVNGKIDTHFFFIRKSLFCLSLNFLKTSRHWASDFLKFFLTFTEINWLEWLTLALIIFYTWIWIPSLTSWMQ